MCPACEGFFNGIMPKAPCPMVRFLITAGQKPGEDK